MSSTDGSAQRNDVPSRDQQDPGEQATAGSSDPASAAPPAKVETDWERKRRLAEIFGDVLPSTTSDERGPGSTGGKGRSAQDEWLLSQVPPHHGGHG